MAWSIDVDELYGDFAIRVSNGDTVILGEGETLSEALTDAAHELKLVAEHA